MLSKLKKLITPILAVLLFLVGFFKGKKYQREVVKDEIINITKKAKKSRDSLADSGRSEQLHGKYKR